MAWKLILAGVILATMLLPSTGCWRSSVLSLDMPDDTETEAGADGDSDSDSDSDSDTDDCPFECASQPVCDAANGTVHDDLWCEDTGDVCCEVDGDADADSDTDTGGDADVDGDTDADDDTETVDELDCEGPDVWYDETFHLCWQFQPSDYLEWSPAVDYCDELDLGGYDDWNLPDIDQLRALVYGCPATEPGGECPVVDSSPISDCTEACAGCWPPGPGPGDCYFQPGLGGSCGRIWSSSEVADHPLSVWTVGFTHGNVESKAKNQGATRARCVRVGE